MDAATEAAVATEVARYAASAEAVKVQAEAAIAGLWASAENFYNPTLVAALAAEAADLSTAGQQTVIGATQEFVTSTLGLISGTRRPPLPRVTLPPIRNGQGLPLVHTRAAERYKRAVATGKSHEDALALATGRAAGLARTDLTLVQRNAQREVMRALGVRQYRRVVRPELSKTGSCGLCIVAADRVYNSDELMPIHPPSCKCITMPIIGDNDPGRSLNREDLDKLYAEAGSNKAADLRRTRYQVNQHGEYGPVLTRQGDSFRGPSKVALEDDPERAERMLKAILPVLDSLKERAAKGENVSGPLAYQIELVARLRAIVG